MFYQKFCQLSNWWKRVFCIFWAEISSLSGSCYLQKKKLSSHLLVEFDQLAVYYLHNTQYTNSQVVLPWDHKVKLSQCQCLLCTVHMSDLPVMCIPKLSTKLRCWSFYFLGTCKGKLKRCMLIRIFCGCEWIITWWIRLSIPARVFLYAVSIVDKSVQGSNASRVVFRGSFKYCCTAKQVSDATLFKNHTERYSPNQKSCQFSPFFSPQTLLQTRAAFLFWF